MTDQPNLAMAPTPHSASWFWKILRFPLVRLVVMTLVVAIPTYTAFGLLLRAGGATHWSETGLPLFFIAVATAVILCTVTYWLLVRSVEWRRMDELALRGAGRELGAGILLGGGLFAAVIGLIALAGAYRITGINPPSAMLTVLAIGIISGFVEEVIARGIIFRIVEEWLGTWFAVGFSAALFGFLHAGNPNATLVSSLAIALSAGPLLAGAYVLTRRLWLCIGVHFAWNFTQGGIFGVAISGNEVQGLFQAELSGPELIAGGLFGPEASIITVVLAATVAICLFVVAARHGRLIAPFWKRRRPGQVSTPGASATNTLNGRGDEREPPGRA